MNHITTPHNLGSERNKRLDTKYSVLLTDLIFQQSSLAFLAIVANACFYLIASWNTHIPKSWLLSWYVFINLSVAVRFQLNRLWREKRGKIKTPEEADLWRRYFGIGVLSSSLCWGIVGSIFLSPQINIHQTITFFIIAGMTSGSVVAYSASLSVVCCYLIPTMALLIIRLLSFSSDFYSLLAAMMFLYAICMFRLAKHLNKKTKISLKLRFENQGLINKLKSEIEEKILADRALRESQERLTLALGASGAATWSWNPYTKKTIWDGNIQAVFGLKHLPKNKLGYLQSIHAKDRERVQAIIHAARNEGREFDVEYRITHPDGSLRTVANRGKLYRTQQGQLKKMSGICWDITDRKRQDKLRKEKEIAEAATKTKSQFLANVSHEIRTPLTAIQGFTAMLLERTELSNVVKKYLQRIENNGRHLISLIDDLLNLSKMDTHQLKLQKVHMSPMTEVTACVSMLKPQMERKHLEFELTAEDKIPSWIYCDPQRFRQVVINLLSNAVKFTSAGKIHVTLSVRKHKTQEASLLCVTVSDTGIGVDSKTQNNLFQPFSRGVSKMVQQADGSGLGLALSQGLANRMGGYLKLVRSEPHRGATFEFAIRLEPLNNLLLISEGVQTRLETPKNQKPIEKKQAIEGKQILVAEDSPDLQVLTKFFLEKAGAHVRFCKNGREAVNEALRRSYDAVLMDIKMPVLDGHHATQELRSRGYQKPIIAFTAHASQEERLACYKHGCDAYLSKPVDPKVLIESIAKLQVQGA